MPWFSSQIHLHEQNHRSYVDVQPRLKITSLKRDTALEPEAGSLNDSEAPGTKHVFLLQSKIKAGLNYTCTVLYVKAFYFHHTLQFPGYLSHFSVSHLL